MEKLEKSIKFLDFMVKTVFISTFIFTVFMGYMAWCKNWEMLANALTDKWFDVMVKELIVMGGIQITKEFTQYKIRVAEMKVYNECEEEEGDCKC